MKITEAAFVAYPVTDIARARAFYEEVLQLPKGEVFHEEQENGPDQYWIEYEPGNVTLAISNVWPPSGQSGPSVALEVEDLDAAVAHLKANGVEFEIERIETPACKFSVIKDPDGNSLIIHKRCPSGA